MDENNSKTILAEIQKAVGSPPRRFSKMVHKYQQPERPRYAHPPDLTYKIYDNYKQILRQGIVRWAAIVQANFSLYEPGPSTSGGRVVYAEDDIDLDELIWIAKDTSSTKQTTPADPAVRKIAEMLTDEMERALDWPIPAPLANGFRVYTTIVQVERKQVPDGFLGLNYFPVLADPQTKYAALVPSEYWPDSLRHRWMDSTQERRRHLLAQPVVTLTPFGADAVRTIASEQGLEDWHLHVGLESDSTAGYSYQLNLSETRRDPTEYVIYEEQGITVAVAWMDAVYLRGVNIDYQEDGQGQGFAFHNPRADG